MDNRIEHRSNMARCLPGFNVPPSSIPSQGMAPAEAAAMAAIKLKKKIRKLQKASWPVVVPRKIAYREKQFDSLKQLLCNPWEPLPSCVLVSGQADTGKSLVVKATLDAFPRRSRRAWVDCRSCISLGLVFQSLLNQLAHHIPCAENEFKPYRHCDNMYTFIKEVKEAAFVQGNSFSKKKIFIVLDHCEKIIDLGKNQLPLFARLREFIGLMVTVVMISQVVPSPDWFHSVPITIYFPQYSQPELLEILWSQRPDEVDAGFYNSYVKIVVNVFFRDCRELGRIGQKVSAHLAIASAGDRHPVQMWTRLTPMLMNARERFHLPLTTPSTSTVTVAEETAQSLNLPYYGKFLLIAAFIASHNHPSTDTKMFSTTRGTASRRRRAPSKRSTKASVKDLSPRPFSVDRLFGLMYKMVGDPLPFTVQLQTLVSTLVRLELLRDVTDDRLTERKLSCLATQDIVTAIAESVEFELDKYLT